MRSRSARRPTSGCRRRAAHAQTAEAALRESAVALGYLKARCVTTTPLGERLHMALNLIRLDKSIKTSIKTKRLLAATSDEFRAALMGFEEHDEDDDE